jgi:hypothetical protein
MEPEGSLPCSQQPAICPSQPLQNGSQIHPTAKQLLYRRNIPAKVQLLITCNISSVSFRRWNCEWNFELHLSLYVQAATATAAFKMTGCAVGQAEDKLHSWISVILLSSSNSRQISLRTVYFSTLINVRLEVHCPQASHKGTLRCAGTASRPCGRRWVVDCTHRPL